MSKVKKTSSASSKKTRSGSDKPGDKKPAGASTRKSALAKTAATRKSAPAAKRTAQKRTAGPSASPAPLTTTVTARIDVGFGNALYIRGEGPGMSWDRGIRMECVGADLWRWTTIAAVRPFPCKVLLNDQVWSDGENIKVQPGGAIVFEPGFHGSVSHS